VAGLPAGNRPSGTLDPNKIQRSWERDVEQFRLLIKTGATEAALRREFGRRYFAVKWAAALDLPISGLPPPPESYTEALTGELAQLTREPR